MLSYKYEIGGFVMNRIGRLLWGIALIIIGVVFALNALEITNINIFFDGWWTLFIIVPCFIDLFKAGDKTANIIGLLIGLFLLLACQDIVRFDLIWKLMLPFILIIIGFSFLFKDVINNKVREEVKKLNKHNQKNYCATFAGQTIDFNKEEFSGCDLDAVFGGIKCDLNGAIIKKDVLINVSAIFGGITIYVPKDINVKITSVPICGGVSDERVSKTKDEKITIYINATCMFGGVEIK